MVIGAKAKSSDGRIEALPGIDVQSGYKQKIVDDPIAVSPGSPKVCFVIHVPESDVAPHFLNGRKGVWVRTDEFSPRFEARLATARTHTDRGGSRTRLGSCLEVCVVPRFPARPLCEQEGL